MQYPISISSNLSDFGFEEYSVDTEINHPASSIPQPQLGMGSLSNRKWKHTRKTDDTDLMRKVTEIMRSIEPPQEEVSRGRAVANSISNLLDKTENTDMPLFLEFLNEIQSLE